MYLEDGHATLVSFSLNPTVHLKEISVTAPGLDGGDAIDITTMRNENLRTFGLRQLKTLTEFSITAAYDPVIYDELRTMINVNQQITVTFSDGSTLTFWGGLRTVTPGEASEGERPTVEMAVTPTNKDNAGAEADYVYAAG